MDGSEEIGNDFKLKCEPKEGSLPLRYEWQKLSDSQRMPTPWLAGTASNTEWYPWAADLDLNQIQICMYMLHLKFPGFVE